MAGRHNAAIANELRYRLGVLEQLVSTLSKEKFDARTVAWRQKGQLPKYVAEHVGSVVGLKETLTWRNRWLQIVWAFLFFVGNGLTVYFCYKTCSEYLDEPTATKIKLARPHEYPYPPYILCVDPWVDYNKTLQMGLSPEAVTYSLGVFFSFNVETSSTKINVTQAKKEFLNFIKKAKYTSMQKYLMDIALDFPRADNDSETEAPIFVCSNGCGNTSKLGMVFTSSGVCYGLPLQPLSSTAGFQTRAFITISTGNYTNYGVQKIAPTWNLYLANQSQTPAAEIETLKSNVISSRSQQFITLGDSDEQCIPKAVSNEYFQSDCVYKCLNELHRTAYGCTVFPYGSSALNKGVPLVKYCNFHDAALQSYQETSSTKTAETDYDACREKCLQPCERTLYDVSVRSTSDDFYDNYISCAKYNATIETCIAAAYMKFENKEKQFGGVLILSESYTFSFTTLIGNVGGVLGIFVGATSMTFVQALKHSAWQTVKILQKKGPPISIIWKTGLVLEKQYLNSARVPFEVDTGPAKEKSRFSKSIVANVTAVVGLRETLTWKKQWLKMIWGLLLCAGIGMTVYFCYKTCSEYLQEPTATKISIRVINDQTYAINRFNTYSGC